MTRIPQPIGLSLASLVNRQIIESSAVDHILNCCFHCSTDTPELHKTSARFLTVQQAVTPTKLLPAPTYCEKLRRTFFVFYYYLNFHSLRILLTAWQYDDSRPCSAVAKHFSQTFFLVRSQNCWWFEVDTAIKQFFDYLSIFSQLFLVEYECSTISNSYFISGLTVSFRKSYSANKGYSISIHLFCITSIFFYKNQIHDWLKINRFLLYLHWENWTVISISILLSWQFWL